MCSQNPFQIIAISRNEPQYLKDYSMLLQEKENHSFETVYSNLLHCVEQNQEFLNPSTSSNSTLLAYSKSTPVGFISIAKVFKPDHRMFFFYVDELYVSQIYRKQGVATALLEYVKNAHPFVRLLCRVDNTNAQHVYHKSEFVLSPTLLGQYYKQ